MNNTLVINPFIPYLQTSAINGHNRLTTEVNTEVTTEVKKLILNCKGEQTRNQLQQLLGLKESEHFRKAYVKPAIEQGLLEMTIPDKPNSRNQKYRLTRKGIVLKTELGDLYG